MPIEAFPLRAITSFARLAKEKKAKESESSPRQPEEVIILSDDDDEDEDEKSEASTVPSSPSPLKGGSGSSSAQTTPSPSPSKKTKMLFGKEARPWTEAENKFILDHLSKSCNRKHLRDSLSRPKTSVATQVDRILLEGFYGVNSKAKRE